MQSQSRNGAPGARQASDSWARNCDQRCRALRTDGIVPCHKPAQKAASEVTLPKAVDKLGGKGKLTKSGNVNIIEDL